MYSILFTVFLVKQVEKFFTEFRHTRVQLQEENESDKLTS